MRQPSIERVMEHMDPRDRYREHLDHLMETTSATLDENEMDAIVVAAGSEKDHHSYRDDVAVAGFKASSEFARWAGGVRFAEKPMVSATHANLLSMPDHAVVYRNGADRPTLVVCNGHGAWTLKADTEGAHQFFDVVVCENAADTQAKVAELISGKRAFYHGPSNKHIEGVAKRRRTRHVHILKPGEEHPVQQAMDFDRVVKTEYEIACLKRANEISARAHMAAREAFEDGATEFESIMAYLSAAGHPVHHAPYPPIACIEEHSSVLHHTHYDTVRRFATTMLIDAGSAYNGMGADITCTYAREDAHPVFIEIVRDVDEFQRELAKTISSATSYKDMQILTHLRIAGLLKKVGVIKPHVHVETAFTSGVTAPFMPHSFGHHLGFDTHDKGEYYIDRYGNKPPKLEDDGTTGWRNRAPYRPGSVVTMEPGIYFPVGMEFTFPKHLRDSVDLSLIWALTRYGGVRIETDMWLHPDRTVNLTRPFLPELTNVQPIAA